ncbi:MAG: L-histidine Nalpha-methyltransferase [Actinomycetota bacterium]|nr:L-histidine Nalpha-methyltransferase [Actinomycetota bacterium]
MTLGDAVQALTLDVHLGPDDMAAALRSDARKGLTSSPKQLQPRWFYDEVGCSLFDRITCLDEYYLTRREREILVNHADDIAVATGADTLVELGSGTSEKTRILLDAFSEAGALQRFVPFDIAEATLRSAAAAVASEYPGTSVHAVVGDFEHHVGLLPHEGLRVVAFLGSTIGNLVPAKRAKLLSEIAGNLDDGESLLLGCDLVKDTARLEAAYNDAFGVTAAFNLNVLSVLNRELGAGFDPERFAHVACFDTENEWIEMRLRSLEAQTVPVVDLGIEVEFGDGEEMRTEVSAKFRREGVERELDEAGLELRHFWSDEGGDFGLFLAFR